jgi:hypothetical protein
VIMCLSRSEENSFTGELGSNQLELALLLQAIDAEEAEATVESDKAMIFGRIRESASRPSLLSCATRCSRGDGGERPFQERSSSSKAPPSRKATPRVSAGHNHAIAKAAVK